MKLLPLAAFVNSIMYYFYRGVHRGGKTWQKLTKTNEHGEEGQTFALLSEPDTAYQFQMNKEFFLSC